MFLTPIPPSGRSGYAKYYKSLREFLSSQLDSNQVEIVPLEDRGVTGNFDVTVDGEMIYSKLKMGQGRAESAADKQTILEEIQERL